MMLQRLSSEELNLVSRLGRDPRFAVAYLDQVLGTGKGKEIALAFSHLALAFDDIELWPEAIDPEEARLVLERVRWMLQSQTEEIQLD